MSIIAIIRRSRELGIRGSVKRAGRIARKKIHEYSGPVGLARTALAVRGDTGKPLVTQMREVIALRVGPTRVSPFDYYAYELYDNRRYTPEGRAHQLGWRPETIARRANDPGWRGVCDDKLLAYAIFQGLGLPYPTLYALYHPGQRRHGALPCLRTPAEMAGFLRSGMCYPFFGKPVTDSYGGGGSSVDGIDRARDILLLPGGEEIAIDDYARDVPAARVSGHRFKKNRVNGYIFQQRIRQHPTIDVITGGRVSTLRLLVICLPAGPRLLRATWRLAVGASMHDNFAEGTNSNLKARVHVETGRVEQVVQGPGNDGTGIYALGARGRTVDRHPDTGVELVGLELPEWTTIVERCLHAAAAFPGLRYQAWDVAIGSDGPIFVELNYKGGLAQMPGGPGLYDDDFRAFLASLRSG